MNEFKNLSDGQLLEQTRSLAGEERKITVRVIAHLEEIERRKLYLARGFSSLFLFCQEVLGYSSDEAMRRISAMRLTRELPEIRTQIETGSLSLTNLAKAQTFFKAKKKSGQTYATENKRKLLQSLEGISTRECDRKLAALSPEKTQPDRERPISPGQTQITFTASDELLHDLQKIRDLLSHQNPGATYGELLQKMAKMVLAKLDPQAKKSVVAPKPKPTSRYIPVATREAVRKRDHGRCQYQDPQTGRFCGSTFMTELDHLKPYCEGGLSLENNLRVLCDAHNRWRAANP